MTASFCEDSVCNFSKTITCCFPDFCSPQFPIAGAAAWLAYSLILLTVVSLLVSGVQWLATQATSCHCPTVTPDWGLLSLQAEPNEPGLLLVPNLVTPVQLSPTQINIRTRLTTSSPSKFQVNPVFGSNYLFYIPSNLTVPVTLSGTAFAAIALNYTAAPPVTPIYVGLAWSNASSSDNTIIEANVYSFSSATFTSSTTFPFSIVFTPSQLSGGGIAMFMYIVSSLPGLRYSAISLSINAVEIL